MHFCKQISKNSTKNENNLSNLTTFWLSLCTFAAELVK